ncbi:hypothetical protein [Pseudotabrizicola formosa]|nr:hypothetical protein [Pseudotabrizicola formosa]
MRRVLGMVAVLSMLAACGADGAPERPQPGVTMTGDARVGVVMQ